MTPPPGGLVPGGLAPGGLAPGGLLGGGVRVKPCPGRLAPGTLPGAFWAWTRPGLAVAQSNANVAAPAKNTRANMVGSFQVRHKTRDLTTEDAQGAVEIAQYRV